MWFKKNKEEKAEMATDKLEEWTEKVETKIEPEDKTVKPVEEWIWVEGYKGTNRDMTCNDYQYVLGEQHDMPDDAEIKECESGFHLCKDLNDVFGYYPIGNSNRFFKVRALVRKADYGRYGEYGYDSHIINTSTGLTMTNRIDKLVARSIIFERELTPDEILEGQIDINAWPEDAKKLALSVSIDHARKQMWAAELIELGYSPVFAVLIVDAGKYEIAKAAASQPDLSMDMKCWMIFK